MISYVQSAQLATSGTSATLAFGSNTGSGHALVVAGRIAASAPSASCTDTQGNTYMHAGGIYNSNGTTKFQSDVFVTANSSAAADSVTFTSTVSGTIDLAIHEYSGLVTSNSSILDPTGLAAAVNGTSTSTTPSSGGTQPSNATCLLFGAIAMDAGTSSFTPGNMGTGVTATVRQNVSALLVTEDNTALAPSLYQANGTLSVAENWSALLVSLVAPHGYLSPIGVEAQFFSNAGAVLAGGKIATYLAGTTAATATYTDYTLGTANANPIVLSSAGRLPGGVWQAPGVPIKVVISDSSNNVLMTIDNIAGIGDPSAAGRNGAGEIFYPQTLAETMAAVTVVNYALPPGQVDRYFANTQPGITPANAANAGFASAVAQAQQTSGVLTIGAPVTVNGNLAISASSPFVSTVIVPAGVLLQVISGTISLAQGATLQINGPFSAPRIPCFEGPGAVGPSLSDGQGVIFGGYQASTAGPKLDGNGAAVELYPEWWGAVADSVPLPVSATSTVAGYTYTIASVGTTNFLAIGASSNTVGVSFVATGAGTGSGMVNLGGNSTASIAACIQAASSGSLVTTSTPTGIGIVSIRLASGYYLTGNQMLTPCLTIRGAGRETSGFVAVPGTCGSSSTPVPAGAIVPKYTYTIAFVGTTNFVAIGAASNTVGVTFVATAAGSGTGTATPTAWFYDNGNAAGIILEDFAMYGSSFSCPSMQFDLRLGYNIPHGTEGYLRSLWIRDCTCYNPGSIPGFHLDINGNIGYYKLLSVYGPTQTAISIVSVTAAGSGYTNGTYTNVPLSTVSGSGTGAQATITVSGGSVSYVAITQGGNGYSATSGSQTVVTASASNIGGTGSGFSATVETLGAFAGVCLLRVIGTGNFISDVAMIGAGAGAYSFYEDNPGGRVSGMEIEAPASCGNNYAPLSIQASSFHEGIIISLQNSGGYANASGTSFDHLVEIGASATYGTLGITYFNESALGTVTGGNILNENSDTYMGGNCSLSSSGQGSAFYAWPPGNLISGNANFSAVSSVAVKLPWPWYTANYKVSLTCNVSSSFPPSPPCVQESSRSTTGFTIAFSSSWTGSVDWSIVVD